MALLSRRNRKKTAYALAFFAILFGFGWLLTRGGAPVAEVILPEPTSRFSAIIQERAVAIPHQTPSGQSFVDVVVQLRNPNPRAGVAEFPVAVGVVSAQGDALANRNEITYLLPGSVQYVVIVNIPVPAGQSVGQLDIDLPENPAFQELPESLSVPSFNAFLRDPIATTIAGQPIEKHEGLVTNTGTLDWQKVEVAVVGFDSDREIVAVGKTFVGRLQVGEQREFSVQWPLPQTAVSQVVAFPGTNIFSEENVVDIIGDPERLR